MDIKKKLEETTEEQKKIVSDIRAIDEQYSASRSKLVNLAIELEGKIKLLKEMENNV